VLRVGKRSFAANVGEEYHPWMPGRLPITCDLSSRPFFVDPDRWCESLLNGWSRTMRRFFMRWTHRACAPLVAYQVFLRWKGAQWLFSKVTASAFPSASSTNRLTFVVLNVSKSTNLLRYRRLFLFRRRSTQQRDAEVACFRWLQTATVSIQQ
jgi:hypothetical protein